MGVAVWRYIYFIIDILIIIITFPYSSCISLFLTAASLLIRSFLKCFFVLKKANQTKETKKGITKHTQSNKDMCPYVLNYN